MPTTQEWIDELKSISVLELSERIKAIEEEFGVSATAVAAAAPAAGAPAGGADGAGAGPDPVRIRQFAAMAVMAGVGRVGYERHRGGVHPPASGGRIAAGQ